MLKALQKIYWQLQMKLGIIGSPNFKYKNELWKTKQNMARVEEKWYQFYLLFF